MKVRFWGTRGSIATPGGATLRYGGNTSCVEVRSDTGEVILIDCGTGAHAFGKALQEQGKACSGHILISHTHWDHIQGLPFFAPLFVEGNEWHIYGPRGLSQSLRDVLAGQMEFEYFPVTLNQFKAKIHYHEVVEGGFAIGDVRITTHYLNHPALTVGYRIEADGASLVYASDHEPHSAAAGEGHGEDIETGDAEHVEFMADADLVIHDAQYTASEYPGKIGWGHSTIEYAVDAAIAARVKQLALYHHDPGRSDEAVDQLVELGRARVRAAGSSLIVIGAAEGVVIELRGSDDAGKFTPYQPSSLVHPASDLSEELVLICGVNPSDSALLMAAAAADGIHNVDEVSVEQVRQAISSGQASLIFLGDVLGDPLAVCADLRALESAEAQHAPIIVVTDQAGVDAARGEAVGVTDWLTRPYSEQYARSRLHAWLLRSMLRWRTAGMPQDEARRQAAVDRLGLLDTEAEERFDRHARIAATALNAPVALVTLVDRQRQWYKSHHGFDFSESARDIGFCAHTILDNEAMIVPDALLDDRFAENPAVIGDPYVRFYAGVPLHAADGSRVGAFCIVDHKPRNLTASQVRMLKDIARMVEEELEAQPVKKSA
jgi:phosphoribosyl 1,2-cyclic phosphodiesterase/DNA-binding response OmpR family regulator